MRMVDAPGRTGHEETEPQRLHEILAALQRVSDFRFRCLGWRRALEREALSAVARQGHRTRLPGLALVTHYHNHSNLAADLEQGPPGQDHLRFWEACSHRTRMVG